jgi:hypothetical protein
MRHTFTRAALVLIGLIVLVFALPSASRAAGTRACKLIAADIVTTPYPEKAVEVGWVAGTIEGGVYFVYDDEAPPIDPAVSSPNLVLSSKEGDIQLWMVGGSSTSGGVVTRKLRSLRGIGTGIYANQRIEVTLFGTFVNGKEGSYTLEGWMCPQRPTPTP